MTVDLQELLLGSQGEGLQVAMNAHVQTMDWHDRATVKQFTEIGIVEAAAAKELGKAGENPRYQPQTSPAAV